MDRSPSYTLIKNYYGDMKTLRSNVPLITHINEGIFILRELNASYAAIDAYCVHPLIQSNKDLAANYGLLHLTDPCIVLLAMEYRSVANEYLSTRQISSIDEIRLSPLKEVNDMLIADKIQNRKDFELYHLGKHARSKELYDYFQNWQRKLGVSEQMHYEMVTKILEAKINNAL